MRKLLILLALFPAICAAQANFGHFSRSGAVKELPQYRKATEEYETLKKRCRDEVERNEQELTRLYVAFLEGQSSFPEPILRKRQSELQQMVDNSVAFRGQLKQWLAAARDSLYQPSYKVVDEAMKVVCEVYSLDYAIDTDAGVYCYINPQRGIDITDAVLKVAMNPGVPVTSLLGNATECDEKKESPVAVPANVDAGAVEPEQKKDSVQ